MLIGQKGSPHPSSFVGSLAPSTTPLCVLSMGYGSNGAWCVCAAGFLRCVCCSAGVLSVLRWHSTGNLSSSVRLTICKTLTIHDFTLGSATPSSPSSEPHHVVPSPLNEFGPAWLTLSSWMYEVLVSGIRLAAVVKSVVCFSCF